MSNFTIYTDSACDLDPQMLKEIGVQCVNMYFSFTNEEKVYANNDMNIIDFYQRMRNGDVAKSAAANPTDYTEAFITSLNAESDILYIGLSGALSSSFNSARIAAEQLREKYPKQKIVLVDTLSASAGEGMLVNLAVEKKNSGATLEETAEYIEKIKKNVCHWFVVDDLVYLKRGGRISPLVAFAGSVLGIKPILHVNENGVPINIAKVRGSKAAQQYFLDKFAARRIKNSPIYISHADNMDAVNQLSGALESKFGAKVDLVTHIGTVLGAHTGPGAIAFYFLDEQR